MMTRSEKLAIVGRLMTERRREIRAVLADSLPAIASAALSSRAPEVQVSDLLASYRASVSADNLDHAMWCLRRLRQLAIERPEHTERIDRAIHGPIC